LISWDIFSGNPAHFVTGQSPAPWWLSEFLEA
jgi:hypothetical protein